MASLKTTAGTSDEEIPAERSKPMRQVQTQTEAYVQTTEERNRARELARGLWLHAELNTVPTRLEEQDAEPCVLCGNVIPEGPAWLIVRGETPQGYTGPCCFDLATIHGVSRWETEAGRPGEVLVPAHLAVQFPPNVQRFPKVRPYAMDPRD
jgi:hypothetical protein